MISSLRWVNLLRPIAYLTAFLCLLVVNSYQNKNISKGLSNTERGFTKSACIRREAAENFKENEGIHIPNQTLYEEILTSDPENWILKAPRIASPQVIIMSVIKNPSYEERQAVRNSWGNQSLAPFQNKSMALIFLVGNNEEDLGCLQEEFAANADLLIVKTKDNYRGLVYKLLMAFRYLSKKYPETHVIKIDRDMVLDVEQVMVQFQEINLSSFVAGRIKYNLHAIRDPSHYWYVPESAYKEQVYPWFIQGRMYLLSADALKSLLKTAALFKVIELEDAFFTGILRHKAQIPIICLPYLVYYQISSVRCSSELHQRSIGLWIHRKDKIDEKYKQMMTMKGKTCESMQKIQKAIE